MAEGEVLNCQRCGRDTLNKCGLCRHCLSGRPGYVRFRGEEKGRRSRDWDVIPEDTEPEDESSDSRYHGGNYET